MTGWTVSVSSSAPVTVAGAEPPFRMDNVSMEEAREGAVLPGIPRHCSCFAPVAHSSPYLPVNDQEDESRRRSGADPAQERPRAAPTVHPGPSSMSQAPVGQSTGLSMDTPETSYQRPRPRIRARSCPFLLLIAITCPMGQLTCVHPRKACSHSAALISSTSFDCISTPSWSCLGYGENKELVIRGRWAKEGVQVDQDLRRELGGAGGMVDSQPGFIREHEGIGR